MCFVPVGFTHRPLDGALQHGPKKGQAQHAATRDTILVIRDDLRKGFEGNSRELVLSQIRINLK